MEKRNVRPNFGEIRSFVAIGKRLVLQYESRSFPWIAVFGNSVLFTDLFSCHFRASVHSFCSILCVLVTDSSHLNLVVKTANVLFLTGIVNSEYGAVMSTGRKQLFLPSFLGVSATFFIKYVGAVVAMFC